MARGGPIAEERQRISKRLATELEDVGRLLWVSSYVRKDPGDEATALVVQTGGSLGKAAGLLLRRSNYYAAGSLIRQLIEVEYLLFEFGRDQDARMQWLSDPSGTRHRRFAPKALRERSGGAFSAKQYGLHCRMGGHPTPEARGLLPDHVPPYDVAVMLWEDLGEHLVGVWQRLALLLPKTGLDGADTKRRLVRINRLAQAKFDTVPPSMRLRSG